MSKPPPLAAAAGRAVGGTARGAGAGQGRSIPPSESGVQAAGEP